VDNINLTILFGLLMVLPLIMGITAGVIISFFLKKKIKNEFNGWGVDASNKEEIVDKELLDKEDTLKEPLKENSSNTSFEDFKIELLAALSKHYKISPKDIMGILESVSLSMINYMAITSDEDALHDQEDPFEEINDEELLKWLEGSDDEDDSDPEDNSPGSKNKKTFH